MKSNSKERSQKFTRSYTFMVYCSFKMQHTFLEDEVQIDPDGDGEEFEPTSVALATLEQELEEYLFSSYGAGDVDVSADSNSFLGSDDLETSDQ